MDSRIDAMQRNPSRLNGLAQDLLSKKNDTNGVDLTLSRIHNILVVSRTPGAISLLEGVDKNLRTKLENAEHAYSIDWYLQQIDNFLTRAIAVQLAGLALQTFMYAHIKGKVVADQFHGL